MQELVGGVGDVDPALVNLGQLNDSVKPDIAVGIGVVGLLVEGSLVGLNDDI